MKILVLDTVYQEALDYLSESFSLDPGSHKADYTGFSNFVKSKRFGTSSTYEYYFPKFGIDCRELIINSLRMWTERGYGRPNTLINLLWGKEPKIAKEIYALGIPVSKWLPVFKYVINEVRSFKPEVIILKDLHYFPLDFRRSLKKSGAHIVGFISNNVEDVNTLARCDLIVSSIPSTLQLASKLGISTYQMMPSFDERNLEYGSANRDLSSVFVGSIYGNTAELLRSIRTADKNLRIFAPRSSIAILKDYGILENYSGEAWGLDTYRIYGRAKIVINRHGSIAKNLSANMRLFEATGMGACVLTEASSNLQDFFIPKSEVIPYLDIQDATKLVADVLLDRSWKAIGRRAQTRVLEEHTTMKRYSSFLEVLKTL